MGADLGMIGWYISRHNNSVSQYHDTHPFFDIGMAEEMWPVSPKIMRWWEHECIIFGIKESGMEESKVEL